MKNILLLAIFLISISFAFNVMSTITTHNVLSKVIVYNNFIFSLDPINHQIVQVNILTHYIKKQDFVLPSYMTIIDDKLYVCDFGAKKIFVFDPNLFISISERDLPGSPIYVAKSQYSNTIFVLSYSNHSIYELPMTMRYIIRKFTLPAATTRFVFSPSGKYLYVPIYENYSLNRKWTTNTDLVEINLNTGKSININISNKENRPKDILLSKYGKVGYMSGYLSGELYKIDLVSYPRKLISSITLNKYINNIFFIDNRTKIVATSVYDGYTYVVDTESMRVITKFKYGIHPIKVALSKDKTMIYILYTNSKSFVAVDAGNFKLLYKVTLNLKYPWDFAENDIGNRIVVTGGEDGKIDIIKRW